MFQFHEACFNLKIDRCNLHTLSTAAHHNICPAHCRPPPSLLSLPPPTTVSAQPTAAVVPETRGLIK
ncbi:unnamed protein product [Cuscuta campestris]|uniref:Uncharacterized protein n=1 Tax=Cuscuta campestris TaxID=132261 RepID=A0A484L5P5_9ASTE|nr:unnamed protein product [Cuscuta campestris]